jgi:hypothetical protein
VTRLKSSGPSAERWFWLAAGLALLCAARAQAQETSLSGFSLPKDQLADEKLTGWAKRFQGTSLTFEQSTTPDTLFPGSQLSPIPSYQWWLSFRPRFYFIPDTLSLRVRIDETLEWLNAVDTTLLREPTFGDTWVDLAYNPPEIWGILSTVGLRSVWGTSIAAMSAGDVVDIGPRVSLVRDFRLKRGGEVELSLASYGLYHFVTSNTGGTQTSYGCTSTDFDPIDCSQNTGQANAQVTLVTAANVHYTPIRRLSIDVSYSLLNTWAYGITGGTIATETGAPLALATSPTDTRLRDAGWFLASVDYEVRRWFSFGVGYYCLRPTLDPDSQYGNPFYSPGNTRIFLTTTFNLDWAYQYLAGR